MMGTRTTYLQPLNKEMAMRRLSVVVTLMLVFLCGRAIAADEPAIITTLGTASVSVVPDRAVLTIAVQNEHEELQKAITENTSGAEKLLKALNGAGLQEGQIESGYMSVDGTGFGGFFFGPSTREDHKHYVVRSYVVTLKDLKMIDKIINVALTKRRQPH
jgi:uncharacterized protein YggE